MRIEEDEREKGKMKLRKLSRFKSIYTLKFKSTGGQRTWQW